MSKVATADYAISYAENFGLFVHPCDGKVPRLQDWPNKATNDPNRIRELWKQYPNSNTGIVTGFRSGVVVVDVDTPGAELQLLRQLVDPAIFDTWSVRTSRGTHYYFRREGHSPSFKLPGIDVQGDGRSVIAPPSIHPSGIRYEWDADTHHGMRRFPKAWETFFK